MNNPKIYSKIRYSLGYIYKKFIVSAYLQCKFCKTSEDKTTTNFDLSALIFMNYPLNFLSNLTYKVVSPVCRAPYKITIYLSVKSDRSIFLVCNLSINIFIVLFCKIDNFLLAESQVIFILILILL